MTTTLQPGDAVDRYVVERVVGRGGQASVYQVRHRDLGMVRALKVLDGRADGRTRARLYAEGRMLAQLRHPNVVGVIDVLEVGDAPALVLEFVGGGNLQERIGGAPLGAAEVDRVFRAVLDGVAAAHAANLVHRDLKPANVLLDDGHDPPLPRVADFGVARVCDDAWGLTGDHAPLGTPHFMAPEQARDARGVTVRADVWALGATLYTMATGRPPFDGPAAWAVLAAASAGKYVPLEEARPDAPERWSRTIEACLVVDPALRAPDVASVRALFDGAPTLEPPERPPGDTWSFVTRDTGRTRGVAAAAPTLARDASPGLARRPAAPVVVAVLAPCLAVFLGLSDVADARLHYPLLRAAGRAVAVEDVVVVALPALPDLRSFRAEWPGLIDRLAAARPAAILIDVSFTPQTASDGAIAEAIRRAGIPVVVPVRVDGEDVLRPGSAELADAPVLGHAVSLADLSIGWVRRARVRIHDEDGRPWWHVAALAAGALVRAGEPVVDGGTLVIGALRNPISRNSFALAPSGPVRTLAADGDLSSARGRVVIVGSVHGDADLRRTPDGLRYGAEVLASEVQTLVRQAAPRESSRELGTALTLGVGVATALARRLAWAPAALALGLALTLATGGTLVPIAGPLVAAALVAWARRRAA